MKALKSFFKRLFNFVPDHRPLRHHPDAAVRNFFGPKRARVKA
ncbi:MAG: hypothetical protein AAB402_00010 [Patescibacteria group bacterium]